MSAQIVLVQGHSMKRCGSSRLHLFLVVMFLLSPLGGCGEAGPATTTASKDGQLGGATAGSDTSGAGASAENQAGGNDVGGSSVASTSAAVPNSSSLTDDGSGYVPIFTPGLEQVTISNRMDRNFKQHDQAEDKSKLYHFKSAGLRMWKPNGFERAENYTGFSSGAASINILTNPFSMKDTTDNIITEAMNQANAGIRFLKDVEIDGYDGKFYVNVADIGNGFVFANFSLAFGDDSFSWIVKGSFPTKDEMRDDFGANVLRAVLSTRVADEKRLPPGEDVAFTIRPNILQLNDGFVDKLVFTKGGTFPVERVDEPIFQATKVPRRVPDADRKQFAQMVMSPTPLFKPELVSWQDEVEIDGMQGYEFVALATDTVSKEPLQIFSVTLFDDDAAYVLCGWVSSHNTDNHIKDFRELSRSFRRKTATENVNPG